MLHILLVILKFIGIILGLILLLILAAVLTAMFIPLRYTIHGKRSPEEIWGRGKVSWLFHLITVRVTYLDGKLEAKLRILFFKRMLFPLPEKELETTEDEDTSDEEVSGEEEAPAKLPPSYPEKKAAARENEPQKESKEPVRKPGIIQKLKNRVNDIRQRIREFFKKVRIFFKKLLKLKGTVFEKIELIRSNESRGIITRFKGHLLYLWKHSGPRRMKGIVGYGFDDPALTGIATGIIYLLMPAKCSQVQLYPNFEHVLFEGELHIKGRIRMVHIARIGWKVFRDKEFRKLLKTMDIL